MGSFFQGPRYPLRCWRAGRFQEGTKRVSGGSDVKESPGVSHYDLKDLLEVP